MPKNEHNNFFKFIKELNKLSEKYNIYIKGNNMIVLSANKAENLKYKYDPLTLEITLYKEK